MSSPIRFKMQSGGFGLVLLRYFTNDKESTALLYMPDNRVTPYILACHFELDEKGQAFWGWAHYFNSRFVGEERFDSVTGVL